MENQSKHHPSPSAAGQRRVQRAYDLALIVTSIALPFSNFLMSQGAFLLVLAWGLDRWYNGPIFRGRSWKFWKSQPLLWAILGLFLWQLIGQLWTDDLPQGWRSLRIQLPLLAFPLILITGRWEQRRGLELTQHTLAFSVIAACIGALWAGSSSPETVNARDWSPFISHIRFSLMIAFILSWWLLRALQTRHFKAWGIVMTIGILGAAFIWKTASITGAILLPLAASAALTFTRFEHSMNDQHGSRAKVAQKWALIAVIGGLGMVTLAGASLWPRYPDVTVLEATTASGENYVHYPDRCMRENNHHVWTRIAWGELSEAWNERSSVPFEGDDGRGQELRMTLLRYLSSLNLTKDKAGVFALKKGDINRIESGVPTILEVTHGGLMRRWDIVKFEVWNALDGGNPSGHSLVQRFLFLQNGFYIFQNQPVLGVGTGDVPSAIAAAYSERKSPLAAQFRLRPHNQYITLLISGGPLSMLLWMTVLFALIAVSRSAFASYPFKAAGLACLIIALSCITEDTLETQAGVTFAGFLIGLLGRRVTP